MTLNRRRMLATAALGAAALVVAPHVSGARAATFTDDGLAIRGYDPVAYFNGAPARGLAEHELTLDGATWRFASAENKAAFEADPARYTPQYGGHCAWAVSQGYTAPIDPEAWSVVDGRLYLNYSKSVRSRWEKDVPGNIRKADANWPGLK